MSVGLLVYFFCLNGRLRANEPQYSQNKLPIKIEPKIIAYECSSQCGGWGDRLRGIFSAYVLALLTDREFKISFKTSCHLEEIFDENIVKWKLSESLQSLAKSKSSHYYRFSTSANNYKKEFRLFLKSNEFQEMMKKDLIVIVSNLNMIDSFHHYKIYAEKILKLGYKIEEFNLVLLLHKFYNDIFKLNDDMQKKYDYYLKKLEKKDDMKLICVQIRGGDQVFKSPDLVFPELYKKHWSHIRENFIEKYGLLSYKIFVTSDHKGAEEDAIREFGNERIFTIAGNITHTDINYSSNNKISSACSVYEKPLLDFHFMQNCDMAVVGRNSGFGVLGVLNRKKPLENLYLFSESIFKLIDENNYQDESLWGRKT